MGTFENYVRKSPFYYVPDGRRGVACHVYQRDKTHFTFNVGARSLAQAIDVLLDIQKLHSTGHAAPRHKRAAHVRTKTMAKKPNPMLDADGDDDAPPQRMPKAFTKGGGKGQSAGPPIGSAGGMPKGAPPKAPMKKAFGRGK